MLKALLKKQLSEIGANYFRDRKTGKKRTGAGLVGLAILYVVLFLMLGGAFAAISASLAFPLVEAGLDWLYFALIGMAAIILGVFGGVFNTYAGLYHAKDNELLLSMPIPPHTILFARTAGVYFMGFIFEALAFIPASVVYFIIKKPSALSAIFTVLLLFIIGFLVLTITCALGWVVALIASKLKNKSFVTVIISVVAIGVYYFFCMRSSNLIEKLVENAAQVGETIKHGALYPFYLLGDAAAGNALSMLIFTAGVAALFALTVFILSRSFIKITTTAKGSKKAVYHEKTVKASSTRTAIFKKELRRFTSSPTYMLNCGLGVVMLPVITVLLIIRGEGLRNALAEITGNVSFPLTSIVNVIAAAVVCLVSAMNDISAPSISLEGKSIWILQSLPIDPADALREKQMLHFVINAVPAVLCYIALGIFFKFSLLDIVAALIFILVFIRFSAALGIILNLKKPNLSWTNETVPIKQSGSILISLFGGWAIVGIIGAGYFLVANFLSAWIYLFAVSAIFILLCILMVRWLKTKGAEIFSAL